MREKRPSPISGSDRNNVTRFLSRLFGGGAGSHPPSPPDKTDEPEILLGDLDDDSYYNEDAYELTPIPKTRADVTRREMILDEEELVLGQLVEGVEDSRIGIIVDVDPDSVNPGDPHPIRLLRIDEYGGYELVAYDPLLFDSLVDEMERPISLPIGGWFSDARLEQAEILLIGAILDYSDATPAEIRHQTFEEKQEATAREAFRRRYQRESKRVEKAASSRRQTLEAVQQEIQTTESDTRNAVFEKEIAERRNRIRAILNRKLDFDELEKESREQADAILADRESDDSLLKQKIHEIMEATRKELESSMPVKAIDDFWAPKKRARVELDHDILDEMTHLETEFESFKHETEQMDSRLTTIGSKAARLFLTVIRHRKQAAMLKGEVEGLVAARETPIEPADDRSGAD